MKKDNIEIGEGFSYLSQLGKGDKGLRASCIEAYQNNLSTARNLELGHAIFLDANVLLAYYQMPVIARQKWIEFIRTNKDRIYLPDQVKREVKRHRVSVMRSYAAQIEVDSPSAYQQEIRQTIKDFLDNNADVLAAYPDFYQDLKAVHKNSAAILQKLAELSAWKVAKAKAYLEEKDIFPLLDEIQQLPHLSSREFQFLVTEFNQLKIEVEGFVPKDRNASIAAYLYKHPAKVFPGIGDLKKKPQTPYGDYLIFHEMMKWLAIHQPDLPPVFLTNDVTKSDWVENTKRPYIHYLENMQLNSGQIFYILHAEQVFTDLLGVDCAHLVNKEDIFEDVEDAIRTLEAQKESDALTTTGIQNLLQELYPNRATVEEEDDFWIELIADLEQDFELQSLFELREILLENYHLLVQTELRRYQVYDQLDALEKTLEIVFD